MLLNQQGVTKILARVSTSFSTFISAAFDNNTLQLYAMMANQTGFQLFSFDLPKGSVSQVQGPYGAVGLAFNPSVKQIIGTLAFSPVGVETLIYINPQNGNVTPLNSFSLPGLVCGIVLHSGLRKNQFIFGFFC